MCFVSNGVVYVEARTLRIDIMIKAIVKSFVFLNLIFRKRKIPTIRKMMLKLSGWRFWNIGMKMTSLVRTNKDKINKGE